MLSVCASVVSNYGLYIVRQAPLSMGFSSQGYWSGLSFPSPRDLLYSGIKLHLLRQQADSLPLVPLGKAPGKSLACDILSLC